MSSLPTNVKFTLTMTEPMIEDDTFDLMSETSAVSELMKNKRPQNLIHQLRTTKIQQLLIQLSPVQQ